MLAFYASIPQIPLSDLKFRGYDSFNKITRKLFNCPWGGKHCAHRNELPGALLHCPICNKFAFVLWSIPDVLIDEELKFRKLLSKFNNLPDWVEPEEAFRLRDEQGCPLELLDEITDGIKLREFIESAKVRRTKRIYE